MRGTLRLAVSIAAATLLCASSAHAEESPTRTEYVAQVEPICEANTAANTRILKNAGTKARSKDQHQVSEAGGQFIHASAAFGTTVQKLSAVPRPAADDARLLKWFKQLGIVKTNLRNLGKALKEGDKILAAHEQIRVEHSANAANNVGFVFDFKACRIVRSRFT
jgi:Pyruvate/2-oxoacid:ferredoxin oxidoreductase gamma subunit